LTICDDDDDDDDDDDEKCFHVRTLKKGHRYPQIIQAEMWQYDWYDFLL